MMEQTNAEAGCITYRFSNALEDENTILVFEEWESDEHLKAHVQAPHMAQFNAQLKNLVAVRSSLKRYVVTEQTVL
jgi:quinol monooxygenase YgiN